MGKGGRGGGGDWRDAEAEISGGYGEARRDKLEEGNEGAKEEECC